MVNRNFSQQAARILIVEDEVLIADVIRVQLESKGYEVIGNAISYDEAVTMFNDMSPDLILLDIRLNGRDSGIDFARFLRSQSEPPPFIFLTSQIDDRFIEMAKKTKPAGYLGKPVHSESLIASIEIALFNFRIRGGNQRSILLKDQGKSYLVPTAMIDYLQAEHVYVRFILNDGKTVLQRGTLKQMLRRLNDDKFVQTHRGYVINTSRVTGYVHDGVYFGGEKIPVSRSRRSEVMALLETAPQ